MRNFINLVEQSNPRVLYCNTPEGDRETIFEHGLDPKSVDLLGVVEYHDGSDSWEINALGLSLDETIPPSHLNLLTERIVTEGKVSRLSIGDNLPFRVYQNPNSSQINNLGTTYLRGIIAYGDLYIWDAYEATHDDVAANLFLHPEYEFNIDDGVARWDTDEEVLDNPNVKRAFGGNLTISRWGDELTEAPIADINHIGNWEKNSSFRHEQDRKLLTNPKAITKIKSMWKFPEEVDYNIILINNPEANRWTEEGIVERDSLNQMFPKTFSEIEPMLRSDQVNILYTNNKGTERVPMTGWVMAHRFGHALFRLGKSYYFREAADTLSRYMEELMVSYGFTRQSAVGYPNRPVDKAVVKLSQEICTFRSARENNLRDQGEVLFEMFAQYIITGKIKFNSLPKSFKVGRSFVSYRLDDEDYGQDNLMLDDLAYELTQYFETACYHAVGKILVM